MKKLVLALLLCAAQPAFALLPPLAQSIKELQQVVENPDLMDYLSSSEKILAIDSVEGGYIVRTQNYMMFVQVVYQSQNRPGPAKFNLVFHEPIKIQP